ncbi:MAG TPA: ATP-binding protein [Anaerolineae bacterium]|nr:PAS domain-containing sensor histidine kinase [Anaerolineae bacterium]HRV93100.1 ATP-binding protein [Anaerolineae bacterium]
MKKKTRSELIDELAILRQRVSQLETELSLRPQPTPNYSRQTKVLYASGNKLPLGNALLHAFETNLLKGAQPNQPSQHQRELKQIAYAASHDLQGPLRIALSYLQLLQERYGDNNTTEFNRFIEQAYGNVLDLKQFLHDLHLYLNIEIQGKEPALINGETALERALAQLQPAIKETQANITHAPLPPLFADELQLVQLFKQLIDNAIKFRGDAYPKIHINIEQKSDSWLFSIHDNGIGIDPRQADRIFVLFQTLHQKGKFPGTGAGLAICRKIVERHGGCIWLDTDVTTGSKIVFTLPIPISNLNDYKIKQDYPRINEYQQFQKYPY